MSQVGSVNVTRVGILGSGIMGSGVAEVAAGAGYEVILRSRSLESAREMMVAIDRILVKAIARGRASEEDRSAILARITVTDDVAALADCDLVIESVVEDLAVKRALFADLDRLVKPGAILATNTSTLPVIELATATQRPESVCGIHFFNPAPVMTLVEVVRPVTASDKTIATAIEFATRCGKDAIET
ncbi:MAG: NAD(P)-binding domain-containing protein, partial [Actinobacteria bacterium]|nr:NAD(P)-binding domain-containing protein [Actinomycetota bacterium]